MALFTERDAEVLRCLQRNTTALHTQGSRKGLVRFVTGMLQQGKRTHMTPEDVCGELKIHLADAKTSLQRLRDQGLARYDRALKPLGKRSKESVVLGYCLSGKGEQRLREMEAQP